MENTVKTAKALETTEKRLYLDQAVAVVVEAGAMFMKAGAEVYRAEDTINHLGSSINGVDSCECYVTVSGLMCSLVAGDQTVTRIARIEGSSRNLAVINAINHISRQSEKNGSTPDQLQTELEKVKKLPQYNSSAAALFGGIGALGFAIFFNGTLLETACVFGIGVIIQVLSFWLEKLELNITFVNGLGAFAAAGLSQMLHTINPMIRTDVLIISSIMLLVPGLTLTNAIRDTVMGEYLSGVGRGMEALIIAVSIAVGVGLALYLFR